MERDDDSIHQTVLDLKNVVSLYDYRSFLSTVHYFIVEFLKCDESQQYGMYLDKSSTRFAVVAMQTEKADHLLKLLGFEATHSPDLVILPNWQQSLPRLKTFCEVVVEELVISKGDPRAHKPLPESTSIPVTAVYVAYHLHLRIQLLFCSTDDQILPSLENQFLRSIEFIEQASCHLGILEKQGAVREVWNIMKSKLLWYIKAPSGQCNRVAVISEIRSVCQTVKYKLKGMISRDYYTLLPHFQNTQALLIAVKNGRMMTRDHVQVFVGNAVEVPHRLFSKEYGESLEELLSIMQRALLETLSIHDIEQVYNIAVWQSENALTYLKNEGCHPQRSSQNMSLAPAPIANGPLCADDRKQTLREILGLLKSAVNFLEFRLFFEVVHMGVEHLIQTEGAEPFRCINMGMTV
jgi:hypothetical protein